MEMMQKYWSIYKKTVDVRQVDHRYLRYKESAHYIKMKMREKRDLVTGTFGKQR